MKAKINKTQENSKCRMCGKDEETVIHMLRESSKLSQTEYKRHNDWFGTKIHLKIFRKYVVEVREKWYKHQLVDVMENNKCQILQDFTVQTDHQIYGRRQDVIAIQKDKNLWQIIYSTRAYDGRVDTKELEKIEH